ncbi:MAG: hypothetical protein H7224_08160 [Polaromonas sp.]|nr:hypothetical protein [Polaromonas sp.]
MPADFTVGGFFSYWDMPASNLSCRPQTANQPSPFAPLLQATLRENSGRILNVDDLPSKP